MKKIYFVVVIFSLLIAGFSFSLIAGNNMVVGQTTSSSDVGIALSPKFTGVWKVKVKKSVSEPTPAPSSPTEKTCTELESSQVSYFNICRDNGYDNVCFNKTTSEYQGCTKDTNNDCTQSNTNADQNILCPATASSPTPTPDLTSTPTTDSTPITSSTTEKTCIELESSQTTYFNICSDNGYDNVCFNKLTGEYQGCTKNTNNDCTESNTNALQNILCPATISSTTSLRKLLAHITDNSSLSNIITLKLCVREGKLEGTVHQGGAFLNGVITEKTIISENEVEFTALSQDNKTTKIKMKLTSDRQSNVIFADGHTAEGRKLNDNRGCLTPGKEPKSPKGPSTGLPPKPAPSIEPLMGGKSGTESGPTMNTPPPKPAPSVEPSMGEAPAIEGGSSMTEPEEHSMAGNEEVGETEMSGPPPIAMGGMST